MMRRYGRSVRSLSASFLTMVYRHLTSVERTYIEVLHAEGHGPSEIGKRIGRDKGTISRELRRNSSTGISYKAEFAAFHKNSRRIAANKEMRKITDGSALAAFIFTKLRQRWSPDEIRDDLSRQTHLRTVCNETLYCFIKNHHPEFKKYLLILSRKNYRKRGLGKRETIPNRRMIDERPASVEGRKTLGHWEGDTVVSSCKNKAIATFAERKSGYYMAGKMEDRTASTMKDVTVALFKKSVPKCLRRTCTNDNGTEFAEHEATEKALTMTIYFAHAYHSWERGTNENTNRLLRQFFPRGTNFSEITQEDIDWAVNLINHRPRKRLNYRTPHDVFHGIPERCTLD